MASKKTIQIFLCYAKPDEDKVEELYKKLSDVGFKPWMAKRDILPGQQWKNQIKKAIKDSDFFLVCMTGNSVNRRGYLQKEIRDALEIWQEKLEEDIYLIPCRLQDCDVPERLLDFQWVNLYEANGWNLLTESLRAGIKYMISDIVDISKLKKFEVGERKDGGQKEQTKRRSLSPLREVLSKSRYCKERVKEAENLAKSIYSGGEGKCVPLPYFTPHCMEHCEAVEGYLNWIIFGGEEQNNPNRDFVPTPEEVMYLLAGAKLHDIGMMYGIFQNENPHDLADNPGLCNKIRNEHETRTTGYILNVWKLHCGWSNREKEFLTNICHFHRRKHNIEGFEPTETISEISGLPVRLKVLAALLRLADACHIDQTRAPGGLHALYNSLGMSYESACHWEKPKLISRIRFCHTKQQIKIESHCPQVYKFARGEFDLTDIVEIARRGVHEELQSVQTVLLAYRNTAFKEVKKEIYTLNSINVRIPQMCLGVWPYLLNRSWSATETAAALVQILIFEIKESGDFGAPWCERVRGMFAEAMKWHPADFMIRNLRKEVDNKLSEMSDDAPSAEGLRTYLKKYMEKIGQNCDSMVSSVKKLFNPNDTMIIHGYSVNIYKFLEAIKDDHHGPVYVVDYSEPSDELQLGLGENQRIMEYLQELGYKKVYLIDQGVLPQVFAEVREHGSMGKILLGTHGVLKNGDLLCKVGSFGLVLTGKAFEDCVKTIAFAVTTKCLKNEIDDKDVIGKGGVLRDDNLKPLDFVNNAQRVEPRVDVVPRNLVNYLVTEKGAQKPARKAADKS